MNKISIKVISILLLLVCFSYAQESVIIIQGTGDPNTSAQIKISAEGENKAYVFADKIIVEEGASLVAWLPDAVSGVEISGEGEIIFLELTIDDIILFFDTAVEEGTLVGKGPGKSAKNRLKALRNMLIEAKNLITDEEIESACIQLLDAYFKTDGEENPPDFVQGLVSPELAILIRGLRSAMLYELNGAITVPVSYEAINKTTSNAELEHNITNDMVIPEEFKLEQNYPNPFNPATHIRFQLPKAEYVVITIYNTLGQTIRNLVNRKHEEGFHQVIWDSKDNYGNSIRSGIYICRIHAGEFVETKKMILLK